MSLFKRKLTAFTAMLAFLSLSSAATFALDTTDANVLGKTDNMSFDHTMGQNRTDININDVAGAVGQVDWKEFSVNSNEHVNFGFSGLSQTIINRVLGGKTSTIMGKMTSSCIGSGNCSSFNSTSKVLFINPAGVIFGQGSQIDINSLTTSTFDMQGARNLKGLSASELANYQNNVLNRASAMRDVQFADQQYNIGRVVLDSNYQDAFNTANNGAPIQYDANATKDIRLDGATFSHWARANGQFDFTNDLSDKIDANGNSLNTNKTLAFVSNNIQYKDSLLRVGGNKNYRNGAESYSQVKLITADGVTFDYYNNGYIAGDKIASTDNHPAIARTITMDNSGVIAQDPSKAAIVAGDISIQQRSGAANGSQPSVKIKDTIVRGTKLVNVENGNIEIKSNQDVAIAHSRLETVNTADNATVNQYGGEVKVISDKGVDVKDSLIITQGSLGSAKGANASGQVTIAAGTGSANIENSKILSDGHTKVSSNNNVNIDNSMLQAYNTTDTTTNKELIVNGAKGVKINNTDMNSKGDMTILAGDLATGKLTGDVTITSDNTKSIAENDANQPVFESKKALKIQGKNTTISNTTLAYNESEGLKFYDSSKSGADYTNNVTIKDNTAFSPIKTDSSTGAEKIASDVTIETNGNLTFDNATAQRAEYAIKFDRKDASGNTGYNLASTNKLNDDGSIDGIRYITKQNPAQVDAVNLNITSTQGNVTVTNGSNINAKTNTTVTANNGNYVENSASTISAGKDINITAKTASVSNKSTVQGGNDANITATTGNISINDSNVIAKANNASLTASAGAIDVTNSSKVEAGNDANVTAKNNVNIVASNVVAGSDSTGYDVTKDANDTIGDANITSTNGSVNIKSNSKVLSQDKDVNITAYNTVAFGNGSTDNIDTSADITAEHNVNIKSTNGNITAEKTAMPTIKYGDRLAFDANKSNIFTSQDSLKSVNVDYKAGVSNQIYTQGDAQFVNSTFESPENFVESGKDVILNNLEVKQATTNPKDTVTEIYANGNVTTYNVTGENLGAKDAGNYHSYPQSVDTNRVAKGDKTMPEYVKGLDSTKLDVNQTKLKVTTDTVKDASNPDNGSITLVLEDADNTKAGVELKARNVDSLSSDPTDGYFKSGYYKTGTTKWDENIDPTQGPEIVLSATDGQIAVKELYSDKLTLNPNDKMFADNTDGTPVITVKDQGGLNLDPTLDYTTNPGPDGFTYKQNYDSKDINVQKDSTLTFEDWEEWKPTGREWSDPDGTKHVEYERVRDGKVVDKITTTKTDQRHTITFDNDGNQQDFTLVYDKRGTETVQTERDITAEQVKQDPSIIDDIKTPDDKPVKPEDFIETKIDDTPCDPEPETGRGQVNYSVDDVSKVTLPREQVEVSKTSTIADNTADQTSNIMSAAAKVSVQDVEATFDDDDDDLE